jgi:hypothetical protein
MTANEKLAREWFATYRPPDAQWYVGTILIPGLAALLDSVAAREREKCADEITPLLTELLREFDDKESMVSVLVAMAKRIGNENGVWPRIERTVRELAAAAEMRKEGT